MKETVEIKNADSKNSKKLEKTSLEVQEELITQSRYCLIQNMLEK
jgi:hypothetical protein